MYAYDIIYENYTSAIEKGKSGLVHSSIRSWKLFIVYVGGIP